MAFKLRVVSFVVSNVADTISDTVIHDTCAKCRICCEHIQSEGLIHVICGNGISEAYIAIDKFSCSSLNLSGSKDSSSVCRAKLGLQVATTGVLGAAGYEAIDGTVNLQHLISTGRRN